MQMVGLLRERVEIGGDFCNRVVDLAIETANAAVQGTLEAAQHVGLSSATFLNGGFLLAAETACAATYRGIQQMLDGELTSQKSSSTIDLDASTSGASGIVLLCG
jgi:hypothetical protein